MFARGRLEVTTAISTKGNVVKVWKSFYWGEGVETCEPQIPNRLTELKKGNVHSSACAAPTPPTQSAAEKLRRTYGNNHLAMSTLRTVSKFQTSTEYSRLVLVNNGKLRFRKEINL